MDADREIELLFPTAGLNRATAFVKQPRATTPTGTNVRAFDALANRQRGGSRPGLSKYIAQRIPAGAQLIQHLNVVVDPTTPALLASAELTGDVVDDPLNPGYFLRAGGDAIQQNRNAPRSAAAIALVQSKASGFTASTDNKVFTFTSAPEDTDNTAVIVVCTRGDDATITVSNANLNFYTQAGSYYARDASGTKLKVSMWYKQTSDGANDQTVRVDTGGASFEACIIGLEYRNVRTGSPLDGTNGNIDPEGSPFSSTWTTNAISSTNSASGVAVAAFATCNSFEFGVSTITGGFSTVRLADNQDSNNDIELVVLHKIAPGSPSITCTLKPTYSGVPGSDDYVSIGATFRR